jgi:hypothetical protein
VKDSFCAVNTTKSCPRVACPARRTQFPNSHFNAKTYILLFESIASPRLFRQPLNHKARFVARYKRLYRVFPSSGANGIDYLYSLARNTSAADLEQINKSDVKDG